MRDLNFGVLGSWSYHTTQQVNQFLGGILHGNSRASEKTHLMLDNLVYKEGKVFRNGIQK